MTVILVFLHNVSQNNILRKMPAISLHYAFSTQIIITTMNVKTSMGRTIEIKPRHIIPTKAITGRNIAQKNRVMPHAILIPTTNAFHITQKSKAQNNITSI